MIGCVRASIRRLRSGVVPFQDVDRLSVGYDGIRQTVGDSLSALAAKGRCGPVFVLGEWGTGKSHMLEFVRAAAALRRMAQVKIDLNARDAPLNHPQRFYPWIAESVSFGERRGLRSIIEDAYLNPAVRDRLLQFAWAPTSRTLGTALQTIVLESVRSGSDCLSDDASWNLVMGADLPWSSGKRIIALDRLGCVARLLRCIGAGGLVAVFDEVETIDQLWSRPSRLGAYDTLATVCTLDAIWAVFGITRRFDQTITRDLERGILGYTGTRPSGDFLRHWRDRRYRVIEPPQLTDDAAVELARLVREAYASAYAVGFDGEKDTDLALAAWRTNPGRNPRNLIRAIIDALDSKRSFGCSSNSRLGRSTAHAAP